MANIETYERQITPNPKTDVDTIGLRYAAFSARNPDEGIGRGLSHLGSAIEQTGLTIADIQLKKRDAQDAIEAVKTQAEMEVGLNEILITHSNNISNPKEFEQRVAEDIGAFFETTKSKTNPRVLKLLQPYMYKTMSEIQTKTLSTGLVKTQQAGIAQFKISQDLLINKGLEDFYRGVPNSTESTLQQHDLLLNTFVANHIYTPEEAVLEQISFKKRLIAEEHKVGIKSGVEDVYELIDKDTTFTDYEKDDMKAVVFAGNKAQREAEEKSKEVYFDDITQKVKEGIGSGESQFIDMGRSPEFMSTLPEKNAKEIEYTLKRLEMPSSDPRVVAAARKQIRDNPTDPYLYNLIWHNDGINQEDAEMLDKEWKLLAKVVDTPAFKYKEAQLNNALLKVYDEDIILDDEIKTMRDDGVSQMTEAALKGEDIQPVFNSLIDKLDSIEKETTATQLADIHGKKEITKPQTVRDLRDREVILNSLTTVTDIRNAWNQKTISFIEATEALARTRGISPYIEWNK